VQSNIFSSDFDTATPTVYVYSGDTLLNTFTSPDASGAGIADYRWHVFSVHNGNIIEIGEYLGLGDTIALPDNILPSNTSSSLEIATADLSDTTVDLISLDSPYGDSDEIDLVLDAHIDFGYDRALNNLLSADNSWSFGFIFSNDFTSLNPMTLFSLNDGDTQEWFVSINMTSTPGFQFTIGYELADGGTDIDITSGFSTNAITSISEGDALHVSFDGTDLEVYLNGSLISSTTLHGSFPASSSGQLFFGQEIIDNEANTNSNYWHDVIDDLWIANGVAISTDASSDQQSNQDLRDHSWFSDLDHWWTGSSDGNTTIYDLIGTADGTLINGDASDITGDEISSSSVAAKSFTLTESELLALFTDDNDDPLSITAVSMISRADGEVIDNGDDTWTFNIIGDFSSDVDVLISVHDGIDEMTATITLSQEDAPSGFSPLWFNLAPLGQTFAANTAEITEESAALSLPPSTEQQIQEVLEEETLELYETLKINYYINNTFGIVRIFE